MANPGRPATLSAGGHTGACARAVAVGVRAPAGELCQGHEPSSSHVFISGALYPLWKLRESGSAGMATLAQWNPFTHAVESIRFALRTPDRNHLAHRGGRGRCGGHPDGVRGYDHSAAGYDKGDKTQRSPFRRRQLLALGSTATLGALAGHHRPQRTGQDTGGDPLGSYRWPVVRQDFLGNQPSSSTRHPGARPG